MPDYSLERAWRGPVAGVDEVGRGALAGPVMAAAVIVPEASLRAVAELGLDDSKKLGPKRCRELYCRLVRLVKVGFGEASVEEIDRLNILQAALLAMQRAAAALPVRPEAALVDGPTRPRSTARCAPSPAGMRLRSPSPPPPCSPRPRATGGWRRSTATGRATDGRAMPATACRRIWPRSPASDPRPVTAALSDLFPSC